MEEGLIEAKRRLHIDDIYTNEARKMEVKGSYVKEENSLDCLEGLLNFERKPTKPGISIIQKKKKIRFLLGLRHRIPFLIIHTETTLGLVRSDFYGKPAIRMDVFSRFLLIFQKIRQISSFPFYCLYLFPPPFELQFRLVWIRNFDS